MSAEEDEARAEEDGAPESPDEIDALRAEVAALKDRLLRAMADTENLRKRAERDRDELRQYAVMGFARSLLPVADNFTRAMAAIPEEARADASDALKAVIDGVEAIQRQLQAALEQAGVKPIEAQGQRFDPHLHQAIAEVPGSGKPAGTVVDVVQGGYTLGERLLRPAMVTVAKAEGAGDQGKGGNGAGPQNGAPQGQGDTLGRNVNAKV